MNHKNILTVHRVLLGLLMLVPGLLKLFVMGPDAIVGMLSSIALFAWAPSFWAWVLIISEIVFGIAILASWRLKHTVWPPIVIMIVAAFSINWGNWPSFIMHLIIVADYFMLGNKSR
ncbi:MAG: DoxX family protein [Nanoarchaeota archaeon]